MKYPWSTTSSSESLSPDKMPRMPSKTSTDESSIPSTLEKKSTDVRTEILDAPTPEPQFEGTHRTLKNRHIQFIGIGGTLGTALFVQIGSSLAKGGPGSLFLAFTIWSTVILAVNNCLSEMVTFIPISSPFVRFADRFVDPALGFASGINFFIFQTALIPFEITAFNLVLQFWTDKVPTVVVIIVLLVSYWQVYQTSPLYSQLINRWVSSVLNMFTSKYYGEAEFWLCLGKVLLAVGVIAFTFVTMCGGNPLHDAYGFRNWNPDKVPGAPFAEYIKEGNLGRFLGFLACLIQASFTIAGPDYVAMTAGEAKAPRRNLPIAFKSVLYRLTGFFVLGSLAIGIVLPYNDEDLRNALSSAHPGAGSSPYVIAMRHLNIPVLPHIVNALILTAVFSAGNSYVFCSSRTLYGLALEGKVPRVFTKCSKGGVPIYSLALTLSISCIAFLSLSNDAGVVIQWFVNLVTASQLLNYGFISLSYIRFHKAMKAQGIPRDTLPYRTRFQPFCGYYGLVCTVVMAFVGGYTVFLPGNWNVPNFLFSYAMIGILPILFIFWKRKNRTKWQDLSTMTFFEQERMAVDHYEEQLHKKTG
ncbi:hypothetical protein D9619_005353 [Psilocybe cf. subviscida]|uniref:Amino acid permease/ SLC12A domain-containing protein n=1 Tax=Psilocybe cf. subviscida TaxID=2480587 RepID=A0A8H5BX45_9AGAR|nr:hypothetical protein D9619_005353 [Psilocybe cf. subviscida]